MGESIPIQERAAVERHDVDLEDRAVALKNARKKMISAAEDAREAARPAAENALDKLSSATQDVMSSVASTVGPALEDARDRLVPVIDDARDKIGPVAASAVLAGKVKGQQAAVRLGLAEEPKKKSHLVRNLLVALGLGAAVAVAYKRFFGTDVDPAWTATRDSASASGISTPDASTTPLDPTDALPEPTDQSDTAPTAPFVSEETVESPVPTTPEEPLEKHDV